MLYRNMLFAACALSPALSWGSDGIIRFSGLLYEPTCAVHMDPNSRTRLASCTAHVISTATVAKSLAGSTDLAASQRDITRSLSPASSGTQWEVIQVTYR